VSTRHAQLRAQQRGIPPLIDQWLDEYGEVIYDGRGAMQLVFTRKSVRRMERDFGREPMRRLNEYMDAYKVVGSCDGRCITIGHRYRHLWRK
jgi:hypothetical protein